MLTAIKQLLVKVSRALDKAKIPYMVIGGQAVLLYGTPRLTNDIDITLGVDIDRLNDVVSIVRKLHLRIIPTDYRKFTTDTMVLPLEDRKSGFRVDFIFSFTPYEIKAIAKARRIKLGRAVVRFACPEDVIIHKIFAGRPRDLEDVKSILIKNQGLDIKYIRKWLRTLGSIQENQENLWYNFLKILK
ncbi:MAG: nucleotidyltransferase [Planctomycetota bacterium]|nr:nucleotidyltransferase [Planctomycetota bacterium]